MGSSQGSEGKGGGRVMAVRRKLSLPVRGNRGNHLEVCLSSCDALLMYSGAGSGSLVTAVMHGLGLTFFKYSCLVLLQMGLGCFVVLRKHELNILLKVSLLCIYRTSPFSFVSKQPHHFTILPIVS